MVILWFVSVIVNILMMLSLIATFYNIKIDKKTALLFVSIGAIVLGSITVMLMDFKYKALFGIVIYTLMTKYILKQNFLRSIAGVGLFYITAAFGEVISYAVLVRHLGFSVQQIQNMVQLQLMVMLLTYTGQAIFILFCILYNRKIRRHQTEISNDIFLYLYLIATLIVAAIFIFTLANVMEFNLNSKIDIINLAIFLVFILSSIILVFLNFKFINKKYENRQLQLFISTIATLNRRLNEELQERNKLEEQLRIHATIDAMTGIANRRTGLVLLKDYMNQAKAENKNLTICYIDADNLKMVNDNYGHNEGDELIKQITYIVGNCLRKSDTLCRLGGDEFLLILPDCNVAQAEEVWDRIKKDLDCFNDKKNKPYELHLSHGYAEYDKCGHSSVDDLITIADSAMYEDKKFNKQCYQAG